MIAPLYSFDQLAELEAAERYVAQGEEIIRQHNERAHRLEAMGGRVSRESRQLSDLLGVTQQNFENHVQLLKRELGHGE